MSSVISFDCTGNNRTASILLWKKLFLGGRVTPVPEMSASHLSASGGTVPWMMTISPGCKPPGMGPVYGIAWEGGGTVKML